MSLADPLNSVGTGPSIAGTGTGGAPDGRGAGEARTRNGRPRERGPAEGYVDWIGENVMGETTAEASSAELMVDLIISLDGYASAEGWPGWWGLEAPEYLAWLEREGQKQYTYLLGANTYRLMSAMSAEAAAADSNFSETEAASLTGLADVAKVVFSSSLRAPLSWPNSRLVSADEPVATGRGTRGPLPGSRFPCDHGQDREGTHLRRVS